MAKNAKKPAPKKDKKKPSSAKAPAKVAKPTKPAPKVTAKSAAKPAKVEAKAPAKVTGKQPVGKATGKAGASGFDKKTEAKKEPVRIERPVPAYLDDLPDVPASAAQNAQSTGPRAGELKSSDLFSEQDLTHFLQLLKIERDKLLEKAKHAVDAGNIAIDKDEMYDEVDLASATIDQNLTFRLLDRDRKLLNEIEHAMNKIHTGEYGYCEGTGEAIPKRRLELRPWTRHSVKYKEQLEKMKKSGRGVVDEDEIA